MQKTRKPKAFTPSLASLFSKTGLGPNECSCPQAHFHHVSGTKVVLLEFKAGKLPQGPPESVKILKRRLLQWFHLAGFTKVSEQPQLLPYQEFLVFQKP